jgi:hypothetical protein
MTSVRLNDTACSKFVRQHSELSKNDSHFIRLRCAVDHALREHLSHAGMTLGDALLSAEYGESTLYRLNFADLGGLPMIALDMIHTIAALRRLGITPSACLQNGEALLNELSYTHAASLSMSETAA